MQTRWRGRVARGLLVSVIAAALASGGVGSSVAAFGVSYGEGGDFFAAIYCTPGLIRLNEPTIWAIPAGDSYSQRLQWVSWNVDLFYSADPSLGWQPSGATAYWYAGKVNDRYGSIVFNGQWYSTQSGQWEVGNPPFWTLNLKGYYAAQMNVVWYMDDGSAQTASAQLWAYGMQTGGFWSDRQPYCESF